MSEKIFITFYIILILNLVASLSVTDLIPDYIALNTTLRSTAGVGNIVLNSKSKSALNDESASSKVSVQHTMPIYKTFENKVTEVRLDYVKIPDNITRTSDKVRAGAPSTGPAVIELLVIVDKEFGDLFQHNYQNIVDYLTVYFWDVNIRFKSLWSVDISIRVNGLIIMNSINAQPFIENARASDGRTEHGRTLNLFKYWMYQQRPRLVKHDVAVLITNSNTEWSGGLAYVGGACLVDRQSGSYYGTAVLNDNGVFNSVTVATHEIAHTVGAPHDDEPSARCPGPYGFIMSGHDDNRRYFFQKCSNDAISSFVNSDLGSCLRRFDGYETTPLDRYFSYPKAGNMQDLCRSSLNNPNAWIDQADTLNCKFLYCKRLDAIENVIWTHYVRPVENIQCGNGGRCFRGKCRQESKLLKNEASGFCLNAKSRFGVKVPAQMFPCPSSKYKTPLDTWEVIETSNGKMLASPFLNNENKESGDKCLWTGTNDGDVVWTDTCNTDNPWQAWELRPVNGYRNRFQLVHKPTGRCAKIISNSINSKVYSTVCYSDSSMIWSWVDEESSIPNIWVQEELPILQWSWNADK